MIVNHRYRFTFIRTRKTASTSVEIALSRVCRPGDIVTPLEEGEELLREREDGNGPYLPPVPIRRYLSAGALRRRLKGKRVRVFRPHEPAARAISKLGKSIWNRCFTFTIERNPWDRFVSLYWWRRHLWERERHAEPFPSLSDFLRWAAEEKPHYVSNWGVYADGDRILVDRVLRYEDLDNELARLASKLGVQEDISLPAKQMKRGSRKDKRQYWEVLSDADAELIARVCRKEIATFGYQF